MRINKSDVRFGSDYQQPSLLMLRHRVFKGLQVLALLSVVLIMFSTSVWSKSFQISPQQEQAMGLQTALAEPIRQIPSNLFPAKANVPLTKLRNLSTPVAGHIIKLNYVQGELSEGDIIAEIESPQLLDLQKQYLAVAAELAIAGETLTRAKKLNRSGVSSTKNLQQARLQVKKLRLNQSQIKRHLELINMAPEAITRLAKEQTLQSPVIQIRAPHNGYIVDLKMRLGERVEKNQNLMTLAENNPLTLVVHLPVNTADKVFIGQLVEIDGHSQLGMVEHIEPLVDPLTQSVDIYIRIDNSQRQLRIGQLFNIRFLNPAVEPSFKVLSKAVSQYNGKAGVFVKQKGEIKLLFINIHNIAAGNLYFSLLNSPQSIPAPPEVIIHGSSVLKSALQELEAGEQDNNQADTSTGALPQSIQEVRDSNQTVSEVYPGISFIASI